MRHSEKILVGKDAILEYLQVSEKLFKKFMANGLPVRVMENRYYAHADNLDNYFLHLTRCVNHQSATGQNIE